MTSQRLGRTRFSSTASSFGFRRRVRTISAVTVTMLLAGLLQVLAAAPATAAQSPDLAPFGTVTASASQNDQDGTFPAGNTIDGDPATRWASGNGPDDATSVFTAWLQVDLGTSAQVDRVGLLWEAAYAVKYTVQLPRRTRRTTRAGPRSAPSTPVTAASTRSCRPHRSPPDICG